MTYCAFFPYRMYFYGETGSCTTFLVRYLCTNGPDITADMVHLCTIYPVLSLHNYIFGRLFVIVTFSLHPFTTFHLTRIPLSHATVPCPPQESYFRYFPYLTCANMQLRRVSALSWGTIANASCFPTACILTWLAICQPGICPLL